MARPPAQPDLRLLSKVSRLYYEQKLTQQEIAHRLHLSRPKVSRLLQQAEEVGIVEIRIHVPPSVYPDLEGQLEQKFGLLEAVVVDADSASEGISRSVGLAAAEYLQRTIEEGDIIGISWGTTLYHMVNSLKPVEVGNLHVVQLIGGLGAPEADVHVAEVCRRLAHVLNSRLTLIPAPGIVGSEDMKAIVMADNYVQSAFQQFASVNVAYLGIGMPTLDSVVMRDGNILTQADVDALLGSGAVGDIALRYFDANGAPIESELDKRVIGITLEALGRIERRVGVAGGVSKEKVVRAALRRRLVNVLVTDYGLAVRLLAADE